MMGRAVGESLLGTSNKLSMSTSITSCFRLVWHAALILGCVALPVRAAEHVQFNNGFSLHCEHRESIGSQTRLYLDVGNSSFVDVPTDQIAGYEVEPSVVRPQASNLQQVQVAVPQAVQSASVHHSLDADFINSVIRAESGFHTQAVSRKGARGLMQLMPDTAQKLGVRDSFDPGQNVDGGTGYLSSLLDRYHGDVAKALAAYNAGPKAVDRYHGVPPYSETRQYVARIIRDYNRKKLSTQRHSQKLPTAKQRASSAATPGGE